jgi:hypothetical protein
MTAANKTIVAQKHTSNSYQKYNKPRQPKTEPHGRNRGTTEQEKK